MTPADSLVRRFPFFLPAVPAMTDTQPDNAVRIPGDILRERGAEGSEDIVAKWDQVSCLKTRCLVDTTHRKQRVPHPVDTELRTAGKTKNARTRKDEGGRSNSSEYCSILTQIRVCRKNPSLVETAFNWSQVIVFHLLEEPLAAARRCENRPVGRRLAAEAGGLAGSWDGARDGDDEVRWGGAGCRVDKRRGRECGVGEDVARSERSLLSERRCWSSSSSPGCRDLVTCKLVRPIRHQEKMFSYVATSQCLKHW
ncbi:hypothetical protein B0H11DRAFT_1899437 [Mycena galericulata]|nr:hypothetical protein B0H11DRAFT_1899437 [Mycena galericulata]